MLLQPTLPMRVCTEFCVYVHMGVRLQNFGNGYKGCFLEFYKLLIWRFICCIADIDPE